MGSCLPQNNGTITRAQEPLQAGLSATYRTATNVTVDTAGTSVDGGYVWDFSGALTGDQDEAVTLQPVTGQWYVSGSSTFATASYATQLSPTSTLLGIFDLTETALQLVGVASPTGTVPPPIGSTQTLLTYATPITVLQFPLTLGQTWTSTSNVTGTADGIDFAYPYTETYTNTVDKSGLVLTPYSTTPFPVLRVSTVLVRTVDFVPTTTRSFSFVAQCFSAVATITSNANETQTEFSTAASIQRLAP